MGMTKCDRSGFCCLVQICRAGCDLLGISAEDRNQRCPALKMEGDVAVCSRWIEINERCRFEEGCSNSALLSDGKRMWRFEGLTAEQKKAVVKKFLDDPFTIEDRRS